MTSGDVEDMTVIHNVAPAQRTGDRPAPTSTAGSARTAEALELLRAAEAVGGDADRPCAGASTCGRPGALTVVTGEGTTDLCGLHAMNVVFSTSSGPLVLVKPEL
jgi:hypothetical protein